MQGEERRGKSEKEKKRKKRRAGKLRKKKTERTHIKVVALLNVIIPIAVVVMALSWDQMSSRSRCPLSPTRLGLDSCLGLAGRPLSALPFSNGHQMQGRGAILRLCSRSCRP